MRASMQVAEAVSTARLTRRIGATMQVLVDSAPALSRKGGLGRNYADAPEIDGIVRLLPPEKISKQLKVGEFTRARIVGTEGHDLLACRSREGANEPPSDCRLAIRRCDGLAGRAAVAARRTGAAAAFGQEKSHRVSRWLHLLVPRRGLEPPRCYSLVPETSASTNSATWALITAVPFGAAVMF